MKGELKNDLLNYGFNVKLNYILKECNLISRSITGLNKKILDIKREYSLDLLKTEIFDSIRESKQLELECIERGCMDLMEIAKELTYVYATIGGSIKLCEDLSDEELRQNIRGIKEKLVEYSSTILSMCNFNSCFLGPLDDCDNSAQIYLLIARLFKMMSALESCGSFDIQGIIDFFLTISIEGRDKNN